MQITKASGSSEVFSEKKLLSSLRAAGVPEEVSKKAAQLVKDKLSSDTNTSKIHDLVSQYLAQHSYPIHQANYNLKRSIFQLGPTGYPFEQFFARILQEFGYRVKVGNILNGRCVSHEIDITAKKGKDIFYIECKFHNRPGLKTDVQVALYTKARFDDITNHLPSADSRHHSWLVSNTKITKAATQYANCQNIKVTSWNYPGKESLFHMVMDSKLHPITSLTGLSDDQINTLLKQDIVTLKDLVKLTRTRQLSHVLPKEVLKEIKQEINRLYSHGST